MNAFERKEWLKLRLQNYNRMIGVAKERELPHLEQHAKKRKATVIKELNIRRLMGV